MMSVHNAAEVKKAHVTVVSSAPVDDDDIDLSRYGYAHPSCCIMIAHP